MSSESVSYLLKVFIMVGLATGLPAPQQRIYSDGFPDLDTVRISVAARNLVSDRNFAFDDRFSAGSKSRTGVLRARLMTHFQSLGTANNGFAVDQSPGTSPQQRNRFAKRSALSAVLSPREEALERIRARVGDRNVAKIASKIDVIVDEDEDVVLVDELGNQDQDVDKGRDAAIRRIVSRFKSRGQDSERLFDSGPNSVKNRILSLFGLGGSAPRTPSVTTVQRAPTGSAPGFGLANLPAGTPSLGQSSIPGFVPGTPPPTQRTQSLQPLPPTIIILRSGRPSTGDEEDLGKPTVIGTQADPSAPDTPVSDPSTEAKSEEDPPSMDGNDSTVVFPEELPNAIPNVVQDVLGEVAIARGDGNINELGSNIQTIDIGEDNPVIVVVVNPVQNENTLPQNPPPRMANPNVNVANVPAAIDVRGAPTRAVPSLQPPFGTTQTFQPGFTRTRVANSFPTLAQNGVGPTQIASVRPGVAQGGFPQGGFTQTRVVNSVPTQVSPSPATALGNVGSSVISAVAPTILQTGLSSVVPGLISGVVGAALG